MSVLDFPPSVHPRLVRAHASQEARAAAAAAQDRMDVIQANVDAAFDRLMEALEKVEPDPLVRRRHILRVAFRDYAYDTNPGEATLAVAHALNAALNIPSTGERA